MEILPQPAGIRWSVPETEPQYVHHTQNTKTRQWQIYDVVASFFAAVALMLVFWFSLLVLDNGVPGESFWLLNLIVFWAVIAYLAFPRLHQIVSTIYVPNYFIGRTRTADGILGDPVNLAFNGSEAQIHVALQQAGWVQADPLTARSAWKIVVASVLRKSYAAAPVSHLYLFGRQEDFAYEREVQGNPARRHHVRFWKTPDGWTLPGGITVDWVAAATYDRSVGLSLFTGQITHKIDAHIDAERDYLIATVLYGVPNVDVKVIERYFNAYHSRNGGGDTIKTDGDLPVLCVRDVYEDIHESEKVAELANAVLPAVQPLHSDSTTQTHSAPTSSIISASDVKELPPTLFWFAGLLVIMNGVSNFALTDASILEIMAPTAFNLVMLTLIRLRQRWAWVVMLALQSLAAILLLVLALSEEPGRLMQSSFPVLLVFALSGTSVRLWVSKGRKDRYISTVR
ncbi:hypothetical protein JOD55_001185 [Arcanobacterium pluranimalium]|uniref:LssY C-terminal domain-containing protein n=1 Tax=Arcanobacterium pluranimalium TaxID=108028 RepID=UPI00195873CA|nr:LssY C-terminal domain-containing protein [Arcanobacterium pluranimalium]MBM7825358.1 hypothetical protein [Arcanobacterium pluranimalium]